MLTKMKIINFQSHKDTTLEFSPGVNVIVGSSRSGKTAILRALNWNRYNKPSGLSMNSYWNRDKKKQPIEPFFCEVSFGDQTSVRSRSTEFNGYATNKGELSAIGQDVPEEIEQIWGMSEVNIQKQFDQPFLISESAAEIARFFNKTIKLDKIDSVLSSAEKKRREANKNIKDGKEALESLQKEEKELGWIDAVESLIVLAERTEKRWNEKHNNRANFCTVVEVIKGIENTIQLLPKNLDEILQKMDKAEAFDKKIEEKSAKEDGLKEIIENIKTSSDIISSVPDTQSLVNAMDSATKLDSEIEIKIDRETALKELCLDIKQQGRLWVSLPADCILKDSLRLMASAETFDRELENKINSITPLESLINNIKTAEDQIKTQVRAIVVFESKLPSMCPACNRPLEGDECE